VLSALTHASQVTVLHVYHHASISFIWWMITYTAPGGDAYFSAALNSFVVRWLRMAATAGLLKPRASARPHVHLLPARYFDRQGRKGEESGCFAWSRSDSLVQTRKKWLGWGRYLTQFQMAQFLANLLQAAYCERYSPYPRFLSTLLFWYMISLLGLFGSFYYYKHVASARDARKKQR